MRKNMTAILLVAPLLLLASCSNSSDSSSAAWHKNTASFCSNTTKYYKILTTTSSYTAATGKYTPATQKKLVDSLNSAAAAATSAANAAPTKFYHLALIKVASATTALANDPASLASAYNDNSSNPTNSKTMQNFASATNVLFTNGIAKICPNSGFSGSDTVKNSAQSTATESALSVSRDAVAIAATNGLAPTSADINSAISETSETPVAVVVGSNLGQIVGSPSVVKFTVTGYSAPVCITMPPEVNGTPNYLGSAC